MVRTGFFQQLVATVPMTLICQDVPQSEVVVGSHGNPGSWLEAMNCFVISHPWLTKTDPDPYDTQLQILVEEMDPECAADDDAIFTDKNKPQHCALDDDLQRWDAEGGWPEPGNDRAVQTQAEEISSQKAVPSSATSGSVSFTCHSAEHGRLQSR
ncbi:unnamed protein product [Prorocentrum cordatum]|uniref:Uncharacterized protein n=1 Tax=Prorocentrum cordatum TaxID=2364126 RepID=A0ABN9PTS3_9DINO|nr:unnamed protein product [Polarella glacialis]